MGLLWLHRHQCDCAHYQSFVRRWHWQIPFRSYWHRTLILGSQHGWNQQGLAASEMTTARQLSKRMKITSILIASLLATAAFLLAQALSPNTGADRSGSPGEQSSGALGTGTAQTCKPQTVANAAKGYTCVVKTKSGSVAWRVEAVISTEN